MLEHHRDGHGGVSASGYPLAAALDDINSAIKPGSWHPGGPITITTPTLRV